MKKNKMILTAGPSISRKEINYVKDAVRKGWNENWNNYIVKFEESFSKYVGVKYALSTSSCTGALYLSLVALGISSGDEVIVPDITWVATASAVKYVNAQPVMADVKRDTWTIDPEAIRKKITSKTKAIIPVHLYGTPSDMEAIMELARNYGLKVIEDVAPAIGAHIKGKKMGSWGDCAGFSFQGAKLITSGEGGMFVTNNEELFGKVKHLNEHGRVSAGFDVTDIGYKYKMSNVQAALGLGQLERVDELINKKITIYNWYKKRLKDIEGISFNKENTADFKSVYWMTSIVLDRSFTVSRDDLIKGLKEHDIDSRPFFPQLSTFRMFKKADNPVAKHLADNGINLPSGHNRSEKEIDYVCSVVRKLLLNKT